MSRLSNDDSAATAAGDHAGACINVQVRTCVVIACTVGSCIGTGTCTSSCA